MLARFLSILLLNGLAGSARADDAERLPDPLRRRRTTTGGGVMVDRAM
jgi:hypothetical protein